MKLITTANGYNYWIGFNSEGEEYYNITPEEQSAPNGGYYNSDYICKIKQVPNLFKQGGNSSI